MDKHKAIVALFLCSGILFSDAQLNLPIRKVGETDYYYRQVKKKETVYGISKELGITKEEIVRYNPSVASGLKKGQLLYFPVSDFQKQPEKENVPDRHIHIVKKGETLYGLSKIYGISIEEIIATNPSARTGLKTDARIVIPVEKTSHAETQMAPYVIKKGETLYRVSVNFNIAIEDLLKANPGLLPSNFRAGDTILIPQSEKANQEDTTPSAVFVAEMVEKGDSFESIAEEYNVTEQELKDANPEIGKLKKGKYVYVPIVREDSVPVADKLYDEVHISPGNDKYTVTILLPLALADSSAVSGKSRQADLYADFYRGFLMALESLAETDISLNVNTFDMANEHLSDILSQEDVKHSDLLFAAGNEQELAEIFSFCRENDINAINSFSVRDASYFENDRVFQINTPSSYMYSAVQNVVEQKFADYEIIYLNHGAETKDLVGYLKKTSLPSREMDLLELKDEDAFKAIISNEDKILFVPSSSDTKQLYQLKRTLTKLKREGYNFALLGYPEWCSLTEFNSFFHDVDTYIYSRYAPLCSDERGETINAGFEYWFGKEPVNSIPMMSVLGYDLGMYFIPSIQRNGNDFNADLQPMSGIQTCIDLKRVSNWSGFINTAVYLVHYRPDKTCEKIVIK